jgi:glycosyltransferase involved in cell wall biosynthesis
MHATYITPFRSPCPVVVSVHDVSFRRYPQYFSWRDRALFAVLLPGSLRRAAGIFALSGHGRDELRQFFPDLRAPIHVVPAAPGEAFRPIDVAEAEPVLARLGVRRPFLLAVGSVQPRKNLVRLVEAYGDIRPRHPDIQLVIVGPDGFRASSVQEAIVRRGLSGATRLVGHVPEGDLVALYNAAIGLVYPSVYEGFGLPVVEAMACAKPVIAANTSSIPEVAGDAAILVDPLDVAALRDAIERLVTDPSLATDLGVRALARAAQFSWRNSALKAVAAYRSLT